MNLRVQLRDRKFLRLKCRYQSQLGFTLIELLLVVTILLTVTTTAAPIYSRFYTESAVENTTIRLLGSFRKAQMYSMVGKQGTSWGVNYGSNLITLYKGTSFVARDTAFDENYTVNSNISITGLSEVNFSRITGFPSATPTITVTGGGNTKSITVNSQGVATR